MRLRWVGLAIALMALALWMAPARAQQPLPQDIIATLNLKVGVVQQNLDSAYLQLVQDRAKAEAEKATLIEWLQAAQSAEKPCAATP